MAKYVFEVLQEAAKKRTKAEKIQVLKQNESICNRIGQMA